MPVPPDFSVDTRELLMFARASSAVIEHARQLRLVQLMPKGTLQLNWARPLTFVQRGQVRGLTKR